MSAPSLPCDWQINRKLVKERGQYLLETGIWSDCQFIVGSEPHQQILEGHKLFLAMSSPVFEAMFFGGMAEKEPIAILDVQPDAFRALLEYIYTDKINLTSFDQACELCYGAKKYMLPHLVEECTKYLWSDLYPKNACRAYEFAKLFEEPQLMERCIRIICDQTLEVILDTNFENVELNTILTILNQDELNVTSELDLFSAISRYATRASKIHGLDDSVGNTSNEANSLARPTIHDAIKKIRFLTLSPQQFAEGPGRSSLLSESEKFAILMRISSSNSSLPLPEGFSSSTVARRRKQPDSSFREPSSISSNNDTSKKMTCNRLLLGTVQCMNTSVLDCALTFTCDKNVCVYGIQVPAQIPIGDDSPSQYIYPELLYAHFLDAEGSRLTYTHFTGRVCYKSLIEISFNRPIYIQRNKLYKLGVVLNKPGCYPIGAYSSHSICNGVTFSFSHGLGGVDSYRDGLIRSIIFSMPPTSTLNSSTSGLSGDHSIMRPDML